MAEPILKVVLFWNVLVSAINSRLLTKSKCGWAFYIAETPSLKVLLAQGEDIAMPKLITQYRVFIGSPGGLKEERDKFFEKLVNFSKRYAEPDGVLFHPVGWEYTTGGVGRPQAQINDDLRQCDYAVFVLHDRWGSETGAGFTSGTEEEWTLAEQLYNERKIRNIALLFKEVDPRHLNDPGKQLEKVLSFKKKIEDGRRYLFNPYAQVVQFVDLLESHLAKWLRDHREISNGLSTADLATDGEMSTSKDNKGIVSVLSFDFWLTDAIRLSNSENPDHAIASFCASKATDLAVTDIEIARAGNLLGRTQFHLGKLDSAISTFTIIADRFADSVEPNLHEQVAKALFGKGFSLGALDRSEEEIVAYDALLARFGNATEPMMCEQVAWALYNKGVTLGALDRSAEAIAAYDTLLTRFGNATAPVVREMVAKALYNKGFTLSALDRSAEAIAAYDTLLTRFGNTTAPVVRELVAKVFYNKGVTLGKLDRSAEAIAAYDTLLARFGDATEPVVREQVAKALYNKGFALGALDRSEEGIAAYDALLARFGDATEPVVREQVAKALYNKGFALGALDRSTEAIAAYDALLSRFGDATDPMMLEIVPKAKSLKKAAKKKSMVAVR
jgi:tetratricopeptide (TPR) repeat protein